MHPDLAPHLHGEECRRAIEKLHRCHVENPYRKFFGECNELRRALDRCLQKEYHIRQKKNYKAAIENEKSMNVLNLREVTVSDQLRTPEELAKYLQKCMLCLKADHISSDGRGVDYRSLATSEAFKDYVMVSRQLVNCDPSSLLGEDERMAFFINLYNCLTIHGLASAKQLPSSVLEVGQFWKNTAYSINGLTFSLDDIEHGILRELHLLEPVVYLSEEYTCQEDLGVHKSAPVRRVDPSEEWTCRWTDKQPDLQQL